MKKLRAVFLASFFFSIHLALVSYIHSSMLGEHVNAQITSVLFAAASALSIALTLWAPRAMRRFGTVRITLALILVSATLLWILGTTEYTALLLGAFVLYFSLNTALLYCIDIFIEHHSVDSNTGNIRGAMLTIMNLGWVGVPFIVGIISTRYGFNTVYLIAAIILSITGVALAVSQRKFSDRLTEAPDFIAAFSRIKKTPALRRVISLNFLLQFFYSWMTLYVPLYLLTLGFEWTTIGIIFSIMLIPFILFPYPAGRIADKFLGEKELMIVSLIIMSMAVVALARTTSASAAMMAVMLFCTRIGASTLEAMNDTYFFKQVTQADRSVISMYRIMQPFAYIVGPVLGAGLLLVGSYTALFFVLAGILLVGALYATRIVDTR